MNKAEGVRGTERRPECPVEAGPEMTVTWGPAQAEPCELSYSFWMLSRTFMRIH